MILDNPLLSQTAQRMFSAPSIQERIRERKAVFPPLENQEEEDTWLQAVQRGTWGGLEAVGALLDVPSSLTRSALTGDTESLAHVANPMNWLSYDGRLDGRDVLTSWGLTEENDPDAWEVADVAGFATEMLLDPTLVIKGPVGALSKAGRAAAKKGMPLVRRLELVRDAQQKAKQVSKWRPFGNIKKDVYKLEDATEFAKRAADSDRLAGSVEARLLNDQGGLFGAYIPFTDIGVNFGTAPSKLNRGIARMFDKGWDNVVYNPVSRKVAQLFDSSVGGAYNSMAQRQQRESYYHGMPSALIDVMQKVKPLVDRGAKYIANPITHRAMRLAGEGVLGDVRALALQARAQYGKNWVEELIKSDPGFAGIFERNETGRRLFDPVAVDNDLGDLIDASNIGREMNALMPDILDKLKAAGVKVDKLDDIVKFLPRGIQRGAYASTFDEILRRTQGARNFAMGLRDKNLKRFVHGTVGVSDAYKDPRLSGLGKVKSGKTRREILAQEYLGIDTSDPDWWKNLGKEDRRNVQRTLNHLKRAPARLAGEGIDLFDMSVPEAVLNYAKSSIEKIERSRVMRQIAAKFARRIPRSSNMPVPEGYVSLSDLFASKKHPNAPFAGLVRRSKDPVYFGGPFNHRPIITYPGGVANIKPRQMEGYEHNLLQDLAKDTGLQYDLSGASQRFKDLSPDELKEFYVPAEAVSDIVAFRKMWETPEEFAWLSKGVDAFNNLFKSSQTMFYPSFYFRNLVSGLAQMAMAGVIDPVSVVPAMRQAWDLIHNNVAPKGLNADAERAAMVATGVAQGGLRGWTPGSSTSSIFGNAGPITGGSLNHIGFSPNAPNRYDQLTGVPKGMKAATGAMMLNPDAGGAAYIPGTVGSRRRSGRVAQIPRTVEKPGPLQKLLLGGVKGYDKAIEFLSHYSGAIDDLVRTTHYLQRRGAGWAPEAASADVLKYHFDYRPSALTNTERMIKKFIPFYRFSKANLPRAIYELAMDPGSREGLLVRAINAASRPGDVSQFVPDFLKEQFSMPLGEEKDGSQKYLTGLGLPTEEAFSRLKFGQDWLPRTLESYLGMTNPLIKWPYEVATQRDLLRGRPIEFSDPLVGRTISNISDTITGERTKDAPEIMPRPLDQLISNSPFSRMLSVARKVFDPRKRESVSDVGLNALDLLTGIKISDVRVDQAKRLAERELDQQLMNDPRLKVFTNYYPPREAVEAGLIPPELGMKLRLQATINQRRKEAAARERLLMKGSPRPVPLD